MVREPRRGIWISANSVDMRERKITKATASNVLVKKELKRIHLIGENTC